MITFINHQNEYYFFAVSAIHASLWVLEDLETGLFMPLIFEHNTKLLGLEIFMDMMNSFRTYWE